MSYRLFVCHMELAFFNSFFVTIIWFSAPYSQFQLSFSSWDSEVRSQLPKYLPYLISWCELRNFANKEWLYFGSCERTSESHDEKWAKIDCKINVWWNMFQIDLGQLVKVTAIATQGYKGMLSDDYTFEYDLKYSKYLWKWYSYQSTCRAYSGLKVRQSFTSSIFLLPDITFLLMKNYDLLLVCKFKDKNIY
jgi:hypothetical protein